MTTTERKGDPSERRVTVVAAVVRRGDGFLLARRPPVKRHGGLWEFPGGKVRDGESERDALARELGEELDVGLVRMGECLFEARDPGTAFVVRFRPAEIRGEPRPLEHPELRWVAPPEMAGLGLAPSDARFVEEGLPSRPGN